MRAMTRRECDVRTSAVPVPHDRRSEIMPPLRKVGATRLVIESHPAERGAVARAPPNAATPPIRLPTIGSESVPKRLGSPAVTSAVTGWVAVKPNRNPPG